jgi:hypothetical protein
MTSKFSVVVTAAIIVLTGQISFAAELSPQAYLARQIPASSANCHDQAAELSRKFTVLTGLQATGQCEATSPQGTDILIRYQASEPLNVVTSAAEVGFPGEGYEFDSNANCSNHLAGEVQSFATLTGHEPLLAFCRKQENYYGRVRWALIVEGFGSSDKKISWASSLFPGKPSSVLASRVTSDVKNTFTDSFTNVRQVFLQDDEHGHLRLTVNYYGKYDEQIQAHPLASVNTMDQCELALSEMRKISADNPAVKTLSYCVNNPYSLGADLVIVLDVTRWYRTRQAAETFKTYEECAVAKPGLIETYRSHYPDTILGGFCTEWGADWKITLLEL